MPSVSCVRSFDPMEKLGWGPADSEIRRQAQQLARKQAEEDAALENEYNMTTFAPLPQITRATDIASKAADLVGGDRDRQHGAKADNFGRIAAVWNAWLSIRKEQGSPLDAHDVGCMMAMMKLARTQSGAHNEDDYVDSCGYSACAGEIAGARARDTAQG